MRYPWLIRILSVPQHRLVLQADFLQDSPAVSPVAEAGVAVAEAGKGASFMKTNIARLFIVSLLLVFYGILLFNKIGLPAAEDLGRHIKNGELIFAGDFRNLYTNTYSYTEPDFPFINHHWLSGVVFFFLQRVYGWGGLVLWKVVIVLTSFLIIFLLAARTGSFRMAALLSIPTIVMLRERTTVRPEIFSMLFIAIFVALLMDLRKHSDHKRIYWLIPIELLWVNMHVFFVFGIVLVFCLGIEQWWLHRTHPWAHPAVRTLAILSLCLILATFVNPNGWAGATYPLRIFNNYGMQVSENQPFLYYLQRYPPLDNISIYAFLLSIPILLVSFLVNFRRSSLFYALTAGISVVGSACIDRFLPIYAFLFLSVTCANFGSPRGRGWKIGFALLFFPLIFLGIFMASRNGLSNYIKPGLGLTNQSADSAVFFRTHGLRGPIFNDYDIGSYLTYALYPEEKVFVDARPEAYPSSFFTNTYLPIFAGDNAWQHMLAEYKFNTIFFYQYDAGDNVRLFLYNRIHDPVWKLVYMDSYAVILVRNTKDNAEIIRRFAITPENAEAKLAPLMRSKEYSEQVGAADLAILLGRRDLALRTYAQVVKQWPNRGKIWMVMGLWESHDNPKLAVVYLQKALATGHITAETYYYLGSAYANLKQNEQARVALTKSILINPGYTNARTLLRTIPPGK
jgi:hypothetical protein